MPDISVMDDYLKAHMLEPGDILTILDAGKIIPKEETQFGRSQFQIGVALPNNQEKIWNVNKTTRDALGKKWGTNSDNWVGRSVKVRKENRTIRGEIREVIFGEPTDTPLVPPTQAKIDSPAAKANKIMKAILKERPDLNLTTVSNLVKEELDKSGGIFAEDTAAILVARSLGVELENSGIQAA